MSAENLEVSISSSASPVPPSSVVEDKGGDVTGVIGTGNNAKNSIVYKTIWWCFATASIFSLFAVLNCWLFRAREKVPDIAEDIRLIWAIFIPVVTLALGYAFGKSETKG